MPAFTVTEAAETGYAATNSISATKIATELKNIPMSIDVITEQLFKDYGLTEAYEIMGLSSGITTSQRPATRLDDSYTVRGFTTFNRARNGNTNFRSYDSANLSRVEVVNGPASVLYGQLDPGGVVNMVTKQPSAKASSDMKLDLGSWDYYRAQLGTTGPLNASKTVTYRVDASYLNRDGYRDFDQEEKMFVAPVIKWEPLKGSSVMFDYERVDVHATGVSNWPRYADRTKNVVKFADMIPRTWNGMGPGLGTNLGNYIYTATIEHALTDRIIIRDQAGVTGNRLDTVEAGATSITTFTPTNLQFSRSLSGAYANGRKFANTLNLAGRFDFGRHHYTRVVAGWEYTASRSEAEATASGVSAGVGVPNPPNWNLADPTTWNRTVPGRTALRLSSYSGAKFWENKYYLVDALSLFDERFMFLGGVNYSDIDVWSKNYITNAATNLTQSKWTPQAGAVFRVTRPLGVFVNYSESFRQITSLRVNKDRSMTPFDPLIAKGLDVGIKYDFGDGRYSGMATWFRNVSLNSRQAISAVDALGAYSYEEQTGESEADGAECRLSANVTKNFQVVGGYTYTDARVTKNPASPAIVGRALPRCPTHSWNLNTSYQITEGRLKGLSTGAAISYRSQAKAFETTDPFFLDPRVVVNARVGYRTTLFGRPVSYNLLVSNLFKEQYYVSSITLADPTSYRLSAEYRF